MEKIPIAELPGFNGPEEDGYRHFVYLQRLPGLVSNLQDEKAAFNWQYTNSISDFFNKSLSMKVMRGGDMNEERVLELPTGEQLHCISYHGSLDEIVELYREYASANQLILAKLDHGKVHILEGKATQATYDLSDCHAYSTD
ncbi:MAG: hypothetical protein IPK87_15830 [Planctomycetes bacterium]|nr:hypothetical protein [Planctomycetota bacterium]